MVNSNSTFWAWFRLVRSSNLLIVVFTQYFIVWTLIWPTFETVGLRPALDMVHFALLVLTTVLIAAGGYVINDIRDLSIDQRNHPESLIISKHIRLSTAWVAYWGISISGLGIAFYLAWHIDNLPLVLLYPAAVILLWWYSSHLKKTPFWGNLTVAIFCAFVAGIVWFAERHSFALLENRNIELYKRSTTILIAYMVFAFLSTLFREITKDMEDIEGDQAFGCRTLPIAIGIKATRQVILLIGLLLLLFLVICNIVLFQRAWWMDFVYVLLAILLPLTYSMRVISIAHHKQDFKRLSRLTKFIMFTGLLYLLIFQTHT